MVVQFFVNIPSHNRYNQYAMMCSLRLLILILLILQLSIKGLIASSDCPFTGQQGDLSDLSVLLNEPTRLNYGNILKSSKLVGSTSTRILNAQSAPASITLKNAQHQCAIPPNNCTPSYYYRSYDGSCNNLHNPIVGMANTRYGRQLPLKYSDDISVPPLSTVGTPLPNARQLSLSVWGEEALPDNFRTLLTMQFGQFVAHDLTEISLKGAPKNCCGKDINNKKCYPILLHPKDPLVVDGKACLHFARSVSDIDTGCPKDEYSSSHSREKINLVTSYLDLSSLYGNSLQQNGKVRQFSGGLLKTTVIQNRSWPPVSINIDGTCGTDKFQCYNIPDRRNQFTPLIATVHTILLREHNRIATVLAQINPQLNDEQLFQEARKINIGQYQKFVYYDYLPLILGSSYMYSSGLIHYIQSNEFIDDYDATVNPAPTAEYAAAAFRYCHNQIPGWFSIISPSRTENQTMRLSDYFGRPENINFMAHNENFDSLIRGISTQLQKRSDNNVDREIKHFFNRKPFQQWGKDLKSMDIHRARDFRLPPYNTLRQYCGLDRAYDWSGFANEIPNDKILLLQRLYASPDDVELHVGGSLESHAPGAILGPTFQCIVGKQFLKTRTGDRFFFERGNVYGGFSKSQLEEIRKSSMAALFCNNAEYLYSTQPNVFIVPNIRNPIKSCASISQIDLTKWTV